MAYVIYGPETVASTNLIEIVPTQQVSNCVMVEVINDTTYGQNIIIPGNSQLWIAPETAQFIASDQFYAESIKLFPIVVMAGTFTGVPQQLTIIGFDKGEQTPPAGTVIDLSKIVVVGNTVQTEGAVATTLTNDGSPIGSVIIETQYPGDTATEFQVKNSGLIQIGLGNSASRMLELGYGTPLQLDVSSSQSSGGQVQLYIDLSGILHISTNGNLHQVSIDGNVDILIDAANGVISTSGANLTLETDNSHALLLNNGSSSILAIEGNGPTLLTGSYKMLTGSLSRVSQFTAAVTTTPAFFNHGLGTTPDLVLGIPDGAATTSTRTFEYDSASMTNTQVKLTGGSSFNLQCLAIKF